MTIRGVLWVARRATDLTEVEREHVASEEYEKLMVDLRPDHQPESPIIGTSRRTVIAEITGQSGLWYLFEVRIGATELVDSVFGELRRAPFRVTEYEG